MRAIRGLVVDNREGNAESIEHTLDLEFERFGWRAVWKYCPDALSARSKVRRADEPFDFAIVDLYLGAELQGGIPVVEELHDRDKLTFVLVVTSRPERNESFVTDAVNAGAVHAVLRAQLSRPEDPWSFRRLAEKIRVHLVKHELVAPGSVRYDDQDPGIVSILESVGGKPSDGSIERGLRVIRSLAMSCLKPAVVDAETFRLRYLVPGRSGAYVCQVDLQVNEDPIECFVLKFGFDRQALELERRLNYEAGRVLGDQVLVSTKGDVQTDSSGYSAIAAKVAEGASTLARWLLLPTTTERQAREVARVLFAQHLRKLFQERLRQEHPAEEWMATPALIRLRTASALDSFEEVLAHGGGGKRTDVDDIRRTLLDFTSTATLAVAQPDRLDDPVQFVHGFGDLHSSNVLVQVDVHARPLLIDASRYGPRHWGADGARIVVDLFLRIRGAGMPALLWDDFGTSVQEAVDLCPQCRVGQPADPSGTAAAFIDEVVANLPEFLQFEPLRLLSDVWHWQWHVALAKEFIRQSSHPDLTPPRMALALVCGAEHLQSATRCVNTLTY